MATSLTYNIDCMEYMKTLPDKAFDLAVVDPPYGDGLQERERDWNRFGQRFDRYKHQTVCTPPGETATTAGGQTRTGEERQKTRRNVGLCELEEPGRRSMQKNHIVGRCAGEGIL